MKLGKRPNQILLTRVNRAESFLARLIGLMGRGKMGADETLWIPNCNSVHTFFMRFSIDLVFVDRNLVVKKVVKDVKPWRLVLPVWGADSVFETNSGFLDSQPLQVGDELYVDRTVS